MATGEFAPMGPAPMSTSANPRLAAALDYAQRGWHVIPLEVDGKAPLSRLVPHGRSDASKDKNEIRGWWDAEPNANVGIACAPSGLVVVDADTYKANCGWPVFAESSDLPETLTQRTGNGGLHYVFMCGENDRFAGAIAGVLGVDVLHNHYIVAAPSVVDGNPYRWETDDEPAPVPEWIPRKTTKAEFSRLDDRDTAELIKGIVTGESLHPNLVPLSARMAGRGFSEDQQTFVLANLMDASDCVRDARFSSRRRNLPRVIESATRKFGEAEDDPELVTAADLDRRQFSQLRYIVPGYIAEGLTIFAGRPKIGKSWACLDIAQAVANGGSAFGGVAVEQGDVLYLALEDNQRRLQWRMKTLLPRKAKPQQLTFATECPRLDRGGLQFIRRWITNQSNPRLVIVDTLAKVRPARNDRDSAYTDDYRAVEGLQRLALELGVSVILVTHQRKQGAEDPIDSISGTLGLSGGADSVLVLTKSAAGATLYGRGRDIDEIESAVEFERQTCRWQILGEASVVHMSEQRREIVDALNEAGGSMSPSAIADTVGKENGRVRQLIMKMTRDGELVRVKRGHYGLPDIATDNSNNNGNSLPL